MQSNTRQPIGGPGGDVGAQRVYIHEFIDVIGQNRARYMHHVTAHWSPIAEDERFQLCFGVWATLGSTGRWPEVVNLWEHQSWDNLARSFAMEPAHPTLQDPALAKWWGEAASLRRGGVDRILVAAPWSPSIDELVATGVKGAVYAHELVQVPPGQAASVLDQVAATGRPAVETIGTQLVGAFRVAMADDSEVLLLWAFPDWPVWVAYEAAWSAGGQLRDWRDTLLSLGARWQRMLLLDSPLNPMRIGRQPRAEDRRPLDEIGGPR